MQRSSKFILTFLMLSLTWMAPVASYAQSQAVQGNPVSLLQYIANNMVNQLKSNKATLKTKPQVVYQLANRYVVPYADITEMSKRVISPRVWNTATSEQRMQFEREFTRILIRTYASALTSYKDQTVRFYPVRGGYEGKSSVQVSSDIISASSQPIHVTYRLVRNGSVWRLYDMSVEGVSLIQSFRSQFSDILAHGDMSDLLKRITAHNDR